MSNLLLQKIVLLRVTEVVKIILKTKRPLLLARSVFKMITIDLSPSNYTAQSVPFGRPGDRLNKKDGLTRYGNSRVKDKTS